MRDENSVLIICVGEANNLALKRTLNEVGTQVSVVRSCAEARHILKNLDVPAVLLSETTLPDGTWADILALATGNEQQVPVIVVSRVHDIELRINALEKGAADFIVPPFYSQDILHVLECARRKDMAIQGPATA